MRVARNTLRAVAAGPMLNTPWAVGDYASVGVEQTLTENLTGQLPRGQPNIAGRQQTS